jgi:hypothetical protein
MNWDIVIIFGILALAIPGLILLMIDMGRGVSALQIAAHNYFSTKNEQKQPKNSGK